MKKLLLPFLGLLFSLSLTSCLTITEEYSFKKNGSGSMSYTIDMSEMASLLSMAGESGEGSMDEQISMADMADRLKGINGVSGITFNEDKKNYVFNVGFKFANLTALNAALEQVISNTDDADSEAPTAYFAMENNTITYYRSSASNPLGDEMMEGEDSEAVYTMLESMKYNLQFNVPKTAKVVYTGGIAEMGGKKNREVNVEVNFREVAEVPGALTTTIVMK